MKYKVFIGSATESHPLAARIARELSESNRYEPIRWWDAFEVGESIYDALHRIATGVDAAVFVLSADDKTWYRGREKDAPRDNVILEWGLFSAFLGRKRTIMVVGNGVHLPSDVSGIVYVPLAGDESTTAEQVVLALDGSFRDFRWLQNQRALIYVDADIAKRVLDLQPPRDWYQRSLYRGTEGARAWLEVEQDVGYIPQDRRHESDKLLSQALENLPAMPRTLVSLGPGSGRQDRVLIARLRRRNPGLQYIPVDISDGLLQEAMSTNLESAHVPFGILGDFEGHMPFVEHIIDQLVGTPRLYALIGNTFGNLDLGEETFLGDLDPSLAKKCVLLLHVSFSAIAGHGRRIRVQMRRR